MFLSITPLNPVLISSKYCCKEMMFYTSEWIHSIAPPLLLLMFFKPYHHSPFLHLSVSFASSYVLKTSDIFDSLFMCCRVWRLHLSSRSDFWKKKTDSFHFSLLQEEKRKKKKKMYPYFLKMGNNFIIFHYGSSLK